MPIYEYECPKCGRFEVLQKVSEKAVKSKPDCDDPKCPCAAERVISSSSFHLKGAGWYKTDYPGAGSSKGKSGAGDKGKSSPDASSEPKDAGSKGSGSESAGKPCGPKCGCH